MQLVLPPQCFFICKIGKINELNTGRELYQDEKSENKRLTKKIEKLKEEVERLNDHIMDLEVTACENKLLNKIEEIKCKR